MNADLEGTEEIDYAAQEGLALIAEGEALKVSDLPSFQSAAVFRRSLKAHMNRITDLFKPMKQAADAAKRVILDQEKALLEGPKAAELAVARQMDAYEAAQRRERALSEARAAEEAKVLTETARRDGVALAGPVVVPAVQVELPKAEGITYASRWVAEITDRVEFLRWLAKEDNATSWMLVEIAPTKMLDDLAKAQKGALRIPGVEAKEIRSARVSA